MLVCVVLLRFGAASMKWICSLNAGITMHHNHPEPSSVLTVPPSNHLLGSLLAERVFDPPLVDLPPLRIIRNVHIGADVAR